MMSNAHTPNEHGKPNGYQSYVLRLWRSDALALASWRASLENIQTGERYGFAGLEDLFAFIVYSLDVVTCSHAEEASAMTEGDAC